MSQPRSTFTKYAALRLFVFFTSVLAVSRATGVGISFEQLDWRDNSGGYVSRDSDWGNVVISLNSADDSQFHDITTYSGQTGRGGFFNLVTDAAGSPDWEVVNLPIFYTHPNDLNGRLPQEVRFALYDQNTTDLGEDVGSLNYLYTIDPVPRNTTTGQPTGSWLNPTPVPVADVDVRVSGDSLWIGTVAPEGGGVTAPAAAQNFEGAGTGETVGHVSSISVPETSVGSVNEGEDECAPGAVARSLQYMSDTHSNVNVTGGVQAVHGALVTAMKTNDGKAGTYTSDILEGKNAYVSANNLPIISAQTGSFTGAEDTLAAGGDVEMGVSWGSKDGDSLGGHRTFVSEIQELVDSSGNTTGYVVKGIDDPDQTDNTAENRTHTYKFDANGNLVQYDGQPPEGTGACLINFQVEKVRASRTDFEFPWGTGFVHVQSPNQEPPYGPPTPYPIPVGKPLTGEKVAELIIKYLGEQEPLDQNLGGVVSQLVVNPDGLDSPLGDGQKTLNMDVELLNLELNNPFLPTVLNTGLELHHTVADTVDVYGMFRPSITGESKVIAENLFVTSSFFDITYALEMPGSDTQFYQLHGEIDPELLGQVWFLGIDYPTEDPEAWVESFFDVSFELEINPAVWDGAWANYYPSSPPPNTALFSMELRALETVRVPEPMSLALFVAGFLVTLRRRHCG